MGRSEKYIKNREENSAMKSSERPVVVILSDWDPFFHFSNVYISFKDFFLRFLFSINRICIEFIIVPWHCDKWEILAKFGHLWRCYYSA